MYEFKNIFGNSLIIKSLQNSIKYNKVLHAYIFYGENGLGKNVIARTFAKTLQCEKQDVEPCNTCVSCKTFEYFNNPDVIYIDNRNLTSIGIDTVRHEINKTVIIKPYKYKYKIIIINNADNMTLSSQNAILKTIENPPSYCIFLFIASKIDKFLPTVLSRCMKYKLEMLCINDVKNYLNINTKLNDKLTNMYSIYSQGNIGKALKLIEYDFINVKNYVIGLILDLNNKKIEDIFNEVKNIEQFKDKIEIIFEIFLIWFRDSIILKIIKDKKFIFEKDEFELIQEYIKNIDITNLNKKLQVILEAKERLRNNGNFQLTMQIMLIGLRH